MKWAAKITRIFSIADTHFFQDFLLKRSLNVLLIQLSGLVVAFGGNVLLARLLGEKTYGVYSLLSSWAIFLSVIALFGMDDTHLVWLPSLRLQQEKNRIADHLKWSLKVNGVTTIIVAGAFFAAAYFFKIPVLSGHAYYFNFVLVMLCLLTFLNNLIYFLRGMDKVVLGEITDKIIRPVIFIVLLLLLYDAGKTDLLTEAVWANVAGLFFTILILVVMIKKKSMAWQDKDDTVNRKPRLSANLRYVSLNLLYILAIRIDILMLGILSTPLNVGHYNVAVRFADILAYPIAIINLSLPSLFSKLQHEHEDVNVPKILYHVSKGSFFQCLVLGIFFLLAGNWVLGWYGGGFTAAFPVICVFLISILISAGTGSIDVFFIMHGEEKKVIYGRVVSVLLIVILNAWLIPVWGTMGAATASLAGNLVYCGILEYLFYKKYKIFIHPFAPQSAMALIS